MAKKEGHEKGVGPYSKDSLPMTRKPDKGYPKPVDIYNRITPSHERNDGFSGKLDKSE